VAQGRADEGGVAGQHSAVRREFRTWDLERTALRADAHARRVQHVLTSDCVPPRRKQLPALAAGRSGTGHPQYRIGETIRIENSGWSRLTRALGSISLAGQ